ncbi:hypothetical protein PGT21_022337 [Puccinia graminis f. sp. tritici]|uniref:Fungal lipase-type domain-containing protein n=1 Tax=Puccinia graminis f. sp. tritici TaxID=56615 RepID=A0A5B0RF81_PUCGR|nr:hypothetical protein PGT21_022337 [Puccinia graminis f. sp. tritici]KAA1124072.1 hypothetical protein PGTUg99_025509 [Puccinia graminis f. sp. tritici]
MDHRGMNCLLAVITFLMLVEFSQTLSVLKARQVTDATNQQLVDPAITDPKAIHADKIMWYTQDPDQQDHIRLHCYLSMAAYGDYRTLCPSTFAVEGNEFEVLQDFETAEGQKGFVARVPFMQKIVIVFRGYDSVVPLSWDVVPIDFGRPFPRCTGHNECTTGRGILQLYNSARIATDNWAVAKQAVNATGLKFSVTGHGIGGSVAQLAALDLGTQGLVHYAHSQAAPRSMSPTAARILSEVFQGESGQHAVANHDYFPHMIPRSKDFVRVNSAVWIFGNRTEWMRNCHYYAENIACLGNGTSIQDNYYYFTPLGQCGSADKGF